MRVGIVGLGLAGLRTAMLLERAGLDVSLFDARDRIGGRASTVEDPGHALHEAKRERQKSQHTQQRMKTAVNVGTTIHGQLFGRKAISATSTPSSGCSVIGSSNASNKSQARPCGSRPAVISNSRTIAR